LAASASAEISLSISLHIVLVAHCSNRFSGRNEHCALDREDA
jgi:hypothetical protein